MEILIALVVLGLVVYYLNNNSSSTKTTTKVITTETTHTPRGKMTVEQTTVITDATLEIKPIHQTTSYFPRHTISTSTPLQSTSTATILPSPPQNNISSEPHQITKPLPAQLSTPFHPQFKTCSGCKRIQPLSEFRPNSNQPDGLTKWCISCLNQPKPKPLKGMKHCPKCKQNRRKTSFYPTTKHPDGLSKWCKFCLDRH